MKTRLVVGLALALILFYAAAVRVPRLGTAPPGLYPDEAQNGNDALMALETGDFRVFYPSNNGREGLFINLLALAVGVLGNSPSALRLTGALVGVLTVLFCGLACRELLLVLRAGGRREDQRGPAAVQGALLLGAFFMATSYWHLGFSRIAFRGILVPLFSLAAVYFTCLGLRRCSWALLALAGAVAGLGLHTYTPFRMLLPILLLLVVLQQSDQANSRRGFLRFLAATVVDRKMLAMAAGFLLTAAPMLRAFVLEDNALSGRSEELSVFGRDNPIAELTSSALAYTRMFFVAGDCNWRHNLDCKALLNPVAGFLFAVGLLACVMALFSRRAHTGTQGWRPGARLSLLLMIWLAAMLLPAALTWEGRPHALRAIGALPPAMLLCAVGTLRLWGLLQGRDRLLGRRLAAAVALMAAAYATWLTPHAYFSKWANDARTLQAFHAPTTAFAQQLNALADDHDKYIVTLDEEALAAHEVWATLPLQFLTSTATDASRRRRRFHYISLSQLPTLPFSTERRTFILFELRHARMGDEILQLPSAAAIMNQAHQSIRSHSPNAQTLDFEPSSPSSP